MRVSRKAKHGACICVLATWPSSKEGVLAETLCRGFQLGRGSGDQNVNCHHQAHGHGRQTG